ncbi:uncharacterized protein BXZ73DRAFT_78255 [Epithele typhae]|uniref:uncharacterized protein n=1 Tax=Epithele typhae TaxID=378194 RepID=UPI002008AC28|nr:uncharacterized protein BXZ73DRAFT_78255 [Epithele typhae]KAH9929119.1 hypothetical protein BXZ73DRAFT_78255 [Epithele typhae]
MSALAAIAAVGGRELAMLNLVKYSSIVSATIVWLEIFAVIEEEVDLLFVFSTIFALDRYNLGGDVDSQHDEQPQGGFIRALASRTLALYNFNRYIVALMGLLGVVMVVPSTATFIHFLENTYYPDETIIRITGCVLSVEDRGQSWVLFGCILASETGLFYYCILLVFSVINLLVTLLGPRWQQRTGQARTWRHRTQLYERASISSAMREGSASKFGKPTAPRTLYSDVVLYSTPHTTGPECCSSTLYFYAKTRNSVQPGVHCATRAEVVAAEIKWAKGELEPEAVAIAIAAMKPCTQRW